MALKSKVRAFGNLKIGALAGALLFFGIQHTYGAVLTFDFTGVVSSVDAPLAGAFAAGDSITGSYTFNSTAPNTDLGDPTVGIYYSSLAYSVDAGSFASTGTGFEFNIFDNLVLAPGVLRDQYRAALGGAGPSVNGLPYSGFSLDLFTNSSNPLSSPFASNALPLTPPSISDFTHNLLTFYFLDSNNAATGVDYVFGTLSTLTVESSTTPLPSTWLLLLSGFTGLGFFAYRGMRKGEAAGSG